MTLQDLTQWILNHPNIRVIVHVSTPGYPSTHAVLLTQQALAKDPLMIPVHQEILEMYGWDFKSNFWFWNQIP